MIMTETEQTFTLAHCPFCTCEMRIQSNHDWHRLMGDHDEDCIFDADDAVEMVPASEDALIASVKRWNRCAMRSTVVPAQDDSPAYGIIDPEYARAYTIIRKLAWEEGYAIGMHGSFTRDLDLIAVPWADKVREPERLVSRICGSVLNLKNLHSNPGIKPHGRKVWTLMLPEFGDPRFIDLSICSVLQSQYADTVRQDGGNDAYELAVRLCNAVISSEFGGTSCLDIDGMGNWFDVRDEMNAAIALQGDKG
jgi:hypothetical protein